MTRCKFRVASKTEEENGSWTIRMRPVTGGSEENRAFWKWTPSGEIVFQMINQAAAEGLRPGAEYYVDVSEAV